MNRVKKLAAFLRFYPKTIRIHGMLFEGVKNSKALQEFYLNPNNEIEMFILLESLGFDSFIDAGAYFGYFSIFASRVSPNSRVVAYEADEDNFHRLQHFIKVNETFVVAHNLAVGDENGEVNFYKPVYKGTTQHPLHGQLGDPQKEDGNLYKDKEYLKKTVKMASLQGVITENTKGRTVLKVDIEGYEEKALTSVKDVLTSSNELDVIVEIMINDVNKNQVFGLMRNAGFDAYLITNAGLVSEDRPLVMPKPNANPKSGKLRTQWKNHFFTKRSKSDIEQLNNIAFGYKI